jgi:hypothetical protein
MGLDGLPDFVMEGGELVAIEEDVEKGHGDSGNGIRG